MKHALLLAMILPLLFGCHSDSPTQPSAKQAKPTGPTTLKVTSVTNGSYYIGDTASVLIPQDPTQRVTVNFQFRVQCGDTSFTPTEVTAASPLYIEPRGKSSQFGFTTGNDVSLVSTVWPATFTYTGKDGGDTSSKTVYVHFRPDTLRATRFITDTQTTIVGGHYGFPISFYQRYAVPLRVFVRDGIKNVVTEVPDTSASYRHFYQTTPPGTAPGLYPMSLILKGPQSIGDSVVYAYVRVIP